jgi:hypothetical protein
MGAKEFNELLGLNHNEVEVKSNSEIESVIIGSEGDESVSSENALSYNSFRNSNKPKKLNADDKREASSSSDSSVE